MTAAERPTVLRTIRPRSTPPGSAVVLEPPPNPPTPPSFAPDRYLFPILGACAGLAGLVYFTASGRQQPAFLLFAAPVMVLSVLSAVYNFVAERRKYARESATRLRMYDDYLHERQRELEVLVEEQRRAAADANPPVFECVARAERRTRLWERSRGDDDFLTVRIGVRDAPASFRVSLRETTPFAAGPPDPALAAARASANRYQSVGGIAGTLPLARIPIVGVAGDAAEELLRAIVIHLCTHHAPADVRVAIVAPRRDAASWVGSRWLPHTWMDDRWRMAAGTEPQAEELLTRLLAHLTTSRAGGADDATIVLVVADAECASAPLLRSIVQHARGDSATPPRIRLIVSGRDVHGLPAWCDAVVEATAGVARIELPHLGDGDWVCDPDGADAAMLEHFSRMLAPVRSRAAGDSAIPSRLTFLQMLGARSAEELNIAGRWERSRPFESTAARIGVGRGARSVALDVHQRADGPNGLLAGTVGSGKSELLLSLVASIAVNHRPSDVNFAILDFKGGATSSQLAPLPHVVSTLTDLQIRDVPRALLSLEAELDRRKRLFREASERLGRSISDLDVYMPIARRGELPPVPYLIIVVDEFTVLKKSSPDDMTRFENIAMQGRSLGVRMLLAAQKPAGEISAQVAANTNFRLCLRVASPGDSAEMIGRPDAAFLARTDKGRGYFRVGNDEVFELFQSAWSGAPYVPSTAVDPLSDIAEVALDGSRRPLATGAAPAATAQEPDVTELQAVIAAIQSAARESPPQRPVWMPPLPDRLRLADVRDGGTGWNGVEWIRATEAPLRPVVGLLDEPALQRQRPLRVDLSTDFHLAAAGAPGSGRTAFLQTLMYSLALDSHPDSLHMYVLAFGGFSLAQLADLPHVGAIIEVNESERVVRLLGTLTQILHDRQRQRITTPDIVFVIDNYDAFAKSYEDLVDPVAALVREGAAVGIHVVVTTGQNLRLLSQIKTRVVLPQVDRGGYTAVLDASLRDVPDARPGRAMISGRPPTQFQTAIVVDGAPADLSAIVPTMRAMAAAAPRTAVTIGVLPAVVPLSRILRQADEWTEDVDTPVPLAVDAETLRIVTVALSEGPHFLLAGTRGGGVTTLLRTWLVALAESFSADRVRLLLTGEDLQPLAGLPHAIPAFDRDTLGDAFDVAEETASRERAVVVAIGDAAEFMRVANTPTAEQLERLARATPAGLHFLIASSVQDVQALRMEAIGRVIRTCDTGFVLGSRNPSHLDVLNVSVPFGARGQTYELPPGLGYYARRGAARRVRVATAAGGADSLDGWLERIRRKAEFARVSARGTAENPASAS